MGQKPCRFIGDFQRPVQLMRAHTLLAGCHHIKRLQCLVQRDAHMLKHSADLYSELFFAVATAPQANTNTLSRVGSDFG